MDELKTCNGITLKHVKCKNIGKHCHNNQFYCIKHFPKKTLNCSICMSSLPKPFVLLCGHQFHKNCIKKWYKYNNSCPVCRKTIFENINIQYYKNIIDSVADEFKDTTINIALQSKSIDEFEDNLQKLEINYNNL